MEDNLLTGSQETDQHIMREYPQKFKDITSARRTRYIQAINDHLGPEFQNQSKPYLHELQSRLSMYVDRFNSTGQNKWSTKIAETQTAIDAGEYLAEGTPEAIYRQNRDARAATFVWPNQDELMAREIEKQQLLQLLQ